MSGAVETFLTDAECEALFMCEPPTGQTRRDQIEQILARHVAASLNAVADEVEAQGAAALARSEASSLGVLAAINEGHQRAARIVRTAANDSGP